MVESAHIFQKIREALDEAIRHVPFSSTAIATAQEALQINQPISHELASGTTQRYDLVLRSGDYAAGSIEQHGKVDLVITVPDGSNLRRFPGSQNEGKRQFAYVAETGGTYQLELTTTASERVRYELLLAEILSLDERLKTGGPPEKYSSPRITALRKQIDSGNTNTDAFWKATSGEGTPLVEPVENDSQHQLATFLWRATIDTRNVLVFCSCQVSGASPIDYAMHHLTGTDVWYLTLKLPTGARFAYQLSLNDPLRFGEPEADRQRQATTQADPLNPHRWACQPGASKYACQSMAELPGAVPQPWIVKNPATPSGNVEKQRIKSAILKNERDLSVYTPAAYKADHDPYALLLVFDEGAYLDRVPAP